LDSVTQFALGAGVGMAVLGRRMGPAKAALAGGLLGSLPDADVFWPFDDPIDRFVLHRSATHSLVIQALVTPLFAEGMMRLSLSLSLREARVRTYLGVYLIFATHALLDAMTIYGTQLFWPLWREPLGVGSVFIIDPLYTLPLLIATLWGAFQRRWTERFGKALAAALIVSTAYLGWGVAAQRIAEARAVRLLADAGISPERAFATPTPFNSLFWRVVAVDGPRYINLYVPLLAGADAITAYVHSRYTIPPECLALNGAARRLTAFSKGFYRLDEVEGALVMIDLRMGLTPGYSFRFAIAEHGPQGYREMAPQRLLADRQSPGDWAWLADGILGRKAVRPAEAPRQVELRPGTVPAAKSATKAEGC
jgi:inner membrane protein